MREAPYRTVKRSIADGIARGDWLVGALLPSEPALSAAFRVSRMTVNRAMRELASERRVRRVPGVGTFVAEAVAQSGLVEIRNIACEIAARGGAHRATVLALCLEIPPPGTAADLDMEEGEAAFRSVIRHDENDVPLQIEDRFVHPEIAPGYLDEDFSQTTPNAFLSRVAPLSEAEHGVQAIAADAATAMQLGILAGSPCLLVVRRTFSQARPVSVARLTHPGSRFRLSGRFAPGEGVA